MYILLMQVLEFKKLFEIANQFTNTVIYPEVFFKCKSTDRFTKILFLSENFA